MKNRRKNGAKGFFIFWPLCLHKNRTKQPENE